TSFSPARTCNSPQSVLGGWLPDDRQPEAAPGTVDLDPGLLLKDESRGANSPQTFLKCFWSAIGSSEFWCSERSRARKSPGDIAKFRPPGCWPDSCWPMRSDGPSMAA